MGKLDGKFGKFGEIAEEQFHAAFWLNARGTLFLASDDSSYVNGLEPVADGDTTAI